jgi:hypothetical protein
MAIPSGFTHLRSGYVEAGDKIYVPALGSVISVEFDSVYIGSSVDSHAAVYRRGKVATPTTFASIKDRCDHARPGDGCSLRPKEDDRNNMYRVIAHKDDQFVYLRSILMSNPGTSEKVCRKSGKVWTWTPTGWDRMDYELRLDDEMTPVNFPSTAKTLQGDSVYYGD